jgi:hypothetical protein
MRPIEGITDVCRRVFKGYEARLFSPGEEFLPNPRHSTGANFNKSLQIADWSDSKT